jgi:hypothetical protein
MGRQGQVFSFVLLRTCVTCKHIMCSSQPHVHFCSLVLDARYPITVVSGTHHDHCDSIHFSVMLPCGLAGLLTEATEEAQKVARNKGQVRVGQGCAVVRNCAGPLPRWVADRYLPMTAGCEAVTNSWCIPPWQCCVVGCGLQSFSSCPAVLAMPKTF